MSKIITSFISWLFFIFLFLLPWQTRWIWHWGTINGAPWEYGTYSIYGTEILLWLIIILFFINLLFKKEFCNWKLSNCQIVKLLTGLLISVLVIFGIILHSLSWEISFQYVFHLLGAVCLFVILSETKNLLNSDSKGSFAPLRMTVALWLGGVLQGVLALWQFLTQSIPANKWLGMAAQNPRDLGVAVIEFGDERWLRAYGSFGWPNSLGIYLAVCLVMGLIVYGFMRRNDGKRIFISIGQVIITTGLVLSFSRSAWLAAVCGLILFAILKIRKNNLLDFSKQIFFILAPAVCLFLIFQPLFLARLNTQNRLENISVSERKNQYTEFKPIFLEHPWLGVGPGAYTLALSKIYPAAKAYELQPVHNIYALTLVEWGTIGFILFALLHCYIATLLWRKNKLWLPIILVLLVAGFFDHWNYTMYTGLVLWWTAWGMGLKKI